jgi:hypothetical protein
MIKSLKKANIVFTSWENQIVRNYKGEEIGEKEMSKNRYLVKLMMTWLLLCIRLEKVIILILFRSEKLRIAK